MLFARDLFEKHEKCFSKRSGFIFNFIKDAATIPHAKKCRNVPSYYIEGNVLRKKRGITMVIPLFLKNIIY
jgi:hypothetical protein